MSLTKLPLFWCALRSVPTTQQPRGFKQGELQSWSLSKVPSWTRVEENKKKQEKIVELNLPKCVPTSCHQFKLDTKRNTQKLFVTKS